MNILKGLVLKDFETIKSYKSTMIYMVILFTICGFFNNNITMFIPVFMPLCFGMVGISSFSYDSLAKADKYILTLPTSKKDIVKARYIYILLVTLFGTIFGLLLTIVAQSIKMKNIIALKEMYDIFGASLGASLGIMFLQSFQIPVMYKFGSEKGRIIQMTLIVVLMIGISLITTTLMKFTNISLEQLLEMLKNYLVAIISFIIIVLYILSYIVSCKFYKNKEI